MVKKRDRGGFTLVEMLVVVAMMVVLISMLLPATRSARAKAYTSACAAKLRGMGAGLHLHMADLGYYPKDVIINPPPIGGQLSNITWAEQLYPFIFGRPSPANQTQVGPEFMCPAIMLQRRTGLRYPACYQINDMTNTQEEIDNGLGKNIFNEFMRPGVVVTPANTLFTADARESGHTYLEMNSMQMTPNTMLTPSMNGIRPHDLKNNFLLLDGHVRTMNVYDTLGKGGTPNRPRWIWTLTPDD